MNLASAQMIVNAVLYEGYILYPYRPTSIKNRQRWTFGGLFPAAYQPAQSHGDSTRMQTQTLLRGNAQTRVEVRVRFLHLVARQAGELAEPLTVLPDDPYFRCVAMLEIEGRRYFTWQEAVEREVVVTASMAEGNKCHRFAFPADRDIEPLRRADGLISGILVRSQLPVAGEVTLMTEPVEDGVHRLTVAVENQSPMDDPGINREQAQLQAMASTHILLGAEEGEFVSLLEPPEALAEAASGCDNQGCWPVLVGEQDRRDTLLASPIILYDYPRIAPESLGDMFDGTEIDEMLTLRILTMTPEEKREMAAADERARALLERTEALTPDQMQAMHGSLRELRPLAAAPPRPEPAGVQVGGVELHVGGRVRLRPKVGGDVFDVVLKGKTAVIEAIERDFEDRVHLAVAIDDDPGRDLGLARMPGHRFFFSPEEVEPLADTGGTAPL